MKRRQAPLDVSLDVAQFALEVDHRGYSKAMTAIPAATWTAPSKSSTPSTMYPFVVT